jgi:hypothetical protein
MTLFIKLHEVFPFFVWLDKESVKGEGDVM